MNKIKTFLIFLFLFFITQLFYATAVDLRNILNIEGFQENPLLGYGVVVGLKGTGDSDSGTQTKEIISRIANNFGFKINAEKIKPKNSAVVLVSALITPFSNLDPRLMLRFLPSMMQNLWKGESLLLLL